MPGPRRRRQFGAPAHPAAPRTTGTTRTTAHPAAPRTTTPTTPTTPTARTAALLTLAAAASLVLAAAHPAAASPPAAVSYVPPVDAPIVDRFRAPAHPYGPGNRGVDYDTEPGDSVRASAGGVVTFAGQVGGRLHAVLLHPDGIRTTYAFLATLAVRRGDRLAQGDLVGTAGDAFHLSARAGDTYLDPLALFGGDRPRVRLVPETSGPLPGERGERAGVERLVRMLRAGPAVAGRAIRWAGANAGAPLGLVVEAARGSGGAGRLPGPPLPPGLVDFVALARQGARAAHLPVAVIAATWQAQRGPCTAATTPTPERPAAEGSRRRLAVKVAGLGSGVAGNGIDGLDVAALGYAEGDVRRFSYAGGTTDTNPYRPTDTDDGLNAAGAKLRALLRDLARDNPGVAIDVFAHSQGGLVARAALAEPVPGVETLVTLATPHQGVDLATVGGATRAVPPLRAAGQLAIGVDPASPGVADLATGSTFIASLPDSAPAGVRTVSVAARADLVVPSPRAYLPGAQNVVVDVPALEHHGSLPRAPAAFREAALAVAGRPPTCQGLVDALVDAAAGHGIEYTEQGLAGVLGTR